MCTVIFIPHKDSFFFASVRDESPTRPGAIIPEQITTTETTYLAPTDALAGGTWLGATNTNSVLILLNGAFQKHDRQKSYRLSRGLIVSEMLGKLSPLSVWDKIDLSNIEPFTLIVWEEQKLFQLIWDASKKQVLYPDSAKPHIWSSSTLYDADAKKQREIWFKDWLKKEPELSHSSLLNFFKSVPDLHNGFIMNRANIMKTVSYTYLEWKQSVSVQMVYHDLTTNSFSTKKLNLQK